MSRRQNETIRIAFCHYSADICGGSDKALYDLVRHLPPERFAPLLVLKCGDPMAAAYRALGIETAEVRVTPPRRALEWGKLFRFLVGFWPSVFEIARVIRRHNADLVHVNTLFNLQGAAAARLARRPLVWHVRELVPDSRAVRVLLWLAAHLPARTVAISTAVAGTLRDCGGKLRIVFDGVDLTPWAGGREAEAAAICIELGIAAGEPIVLTAGRLEPWKGQHVLVEAIPDILAAHPTAWVLFAGGPAVNKPRYAAQLAERCRALGVSERVRFLGIRGDVPALLAASSVLVLPTVTPEPFGLTVIEAMAAQRPVVATAAGGPLDTVLDGETGFLTTPNDSKALAANVCRVLDDPDRARRLGCAGRRRVEASFSIDRVAREMAVLFEELVATR